MTYDVVTIGDAFEDIFIEAKGLDVRRDSDYLSGKGVCFELGEKIPLKDVEYEIGGSACNVAVGLSRLKLNTSIVTVVGNDGPADNIFKRLAREQVDQGNIKQISSIRSNFSVVFRIGEARTIFVYHSLEDYSAIRLKKTLQSKWYFLAPIGEGTENLENDLISKISEDHSMLAWNPGTKQIKSGTSKWRHILKCTSVLFLNKEESIRFLNYPVQPRDEEVMKKLHVLGPKLVVSTNGKEGAKVYDGKHFYKIEAFQNIKKVDATGAGDSFATGFVASLIHSEWKPDGENNEEIIPQAMKWAVLNSSSVIGFVGGQPGLLRKTEMEEEAGKRRFEISVR